MKIKDLLPILICLLLLFMAISCTNAPQQTVSQDITKTDTPATERESIGPDSGALKELNSVIARAEAARKKGLEIDCPNIYPADWQPANSLYTNAVQYKKVSTLREIEESTVRFEMAADAFEKTIEKTLPLLAPGKQRELAEARSAAAKYIAEEKERERAEAREYANLRSQAKAETLATANKGLTKVDEEASKAEEKYLADLRTQQTADPTSSGTGELYPLPLQYTVRPWANSKDSLHNIAGYPWVYNDSNKWRILYEENKSRLPDPDNPGLIRPGMVLTIPSIKGEVRQGMWEAGRNYPVYK